VCKIEAGTSHIIHLLFFFRCSAQVINPEWVALDKSRGYESYDLQVFMRYTALFTDLLIYTTAAIYFATTVWGKRGDVLGKVCCVWCFYGFIQAYLPQLFRRTSVEHSDLGSADSTWTDYHRPWPFPVSSSSNANMHVGLTSFFTLRYNSAMLGFSLWAIALMVNGHDILGGIMFCLSLSFKQMALYYSLPFFFYLLGKSFKKG
jgi:alpha-1,3-glucosyltransferase